MQIKKSRRNFWLLLITLSVAATGALQLLMYLFGAINVYVAALAITALAGLYILVKEKNYVMLGIIVVCAFILLDYVLISIGSR
tara:strand:- start:89 stop:340 length:252 start_codon:yes stop_codon:yes gene_type:complete